MNNIIYREKYLKYKKKYFNKLQTAGNNQLNINILVNMQNYNFDFISLSSINKNLNNYRLKDVDNDGDVNNYIDDLNKICNFINKSNGYTIFTKNCEYTDIPDIPFKEYIKNSTIENKVNTLYKNIIRKYTDFDNLFFLCDSEKYKNIIDNIYQFLNSSYNSIRISNNIDFRPTVNYNLTPTREKFTQLLFNQYNNYSGISIFDNCIEKKSKIIPFDLNYSTGLFEYIHEIWLFELNPIININMIGHKSDSYIFTSLIYGIVIYNKTYNKLYFTNVDINFNYHIVYDIDNLHEELTFIKNNLIKNIKIIPNCEHDYMSGTIHIYINNINYVIILDKGNIKN